MKRRVEVETPKAVGTVKQEMPRCTEDFRIDGRGDMQSGDEQKAHDDSKSLKTCLNEDACDADLGKDAPLRRIPAKIRVPCNKYDRDRQVVMYLDVSHRLWRSLGFKNSPRTLKTS